LGAWAWAPNPKTPIPNPHPQKRNNIQLYKVKNIINKFLVLLLINISKKINPKNK